MPSPPKPLSDSDQTLARRQWAQKAGRSRSEAKLRAAKENLKAARARRWAFAKLDTESPQKDHSRKDATAHARHHSPPALVPFPTAPKPPASTPSPKGRPGSHL